MTFGNMPTWTHTGAAPNQVADALRKRGPLVLVTHPSIPLGEGRVSQVAEMIYVTDRQLAEAILADKRTRRGMSNHKDAASVMEAVGMGTASPLLATFALPEELTMLISNERHAALRKGYRLNREDMKQLRVIVEEKVDTLLDEFAAVAERNKGLADFGLAAQPLPGMVTSHILGLREEARVEFGRNVLEVFAANPDAFPNNVELIKSVIREKKLDAGIIKKLLEGKELSDEEIAWSASQYGVGGFDTTRALIMNALKELVTNLRWIQMVNNGELTWQDIIMASLAQKAPAPELGMIFFTEDVNIHGHSIPKGVPIVIAYQAIQRAAGNINFDPARNNKPFVFGHGEHYCPGAPLALLMAQVMLEKAFSRFTLTKAWEGELPHLNAIMTNQPIKLPVRVAQK